MALRAVMIEVAVHMIGVGGISEVALMAGETIFRRTGVLSGVATHAIEIQMRSLHYNCR